MQMEDEGPNTTVFNLLKTFDTYAALYKEESSGEDSFLKIDSLPRPDSLQIQYEQKMKAFPRHTPLQRWRPGKPSLTASWDYCLVSFPFWAMGPLEEQAEQIHSDTRLLQMEREKMQMELSHKRARIELEKTANLNADKFEVSWGAGCGDGLLPL
ncbi:Mitotic spindle assembly checkpoint protein MAD1 [Ophiophagus hannah]|uniref:Mitotic spindle assembly checkpoint protein MAD1 n=1 Tax=Ophiophagus hannah TaxID=8665 RepID=V8NZU7_OPHHA|nr:Mitotic spindle assembly checkpoint protein MAD1 [Ophiophagus hannah]